MKNKKNLFLIFLFSAVFFIGSAVSVSANVVGSYTDDGVGGFDAGATKYWDIYQSGAGRLFWQVSSGHPRALLIDADFEFTCFAADHPDGYQGEGSYHLCRSLSDRPIGTSTISVYTSYANVFLSAVAISGISDDAIFDFPYSTSTAQISSSDWNNNLEIDVSRIWTISGQMINFLSIAGRGDGYDGQRFTVYTPGLQNNFTTVISPVNKTQGIFYQEIGASGMINANFNFSLISQWAPSDFFRYRSILVYEPSIPPIVNDFYDEGDYVVPKSVNCRPALEYCDMVFGYRIGAFSRSLASTTPDMEIYPRFAWYWPNQLAEPIVSSTIRKFIDYGQPPLTVKFNYEPLATTTSDYILRIQDSGNPAGEDVAYVVRVNVIGVGEDVDKDPSTTCVGECVDSFFGGIYCGLKKTICWAIYPDKEAWLYLSGAYDRLTNKFPFSVPGDVMRTFLDGVEGKTDDRSEGFTMPMIDKDGDIYMLEVMTSSSLSNLIGETNAGLFRNTIIWFLWIVFALGVLVIFLKNK